MFLSLLCHCTVLVVWGNASFGRNLWLAEKPPVCPRGNGFPFSVLSEDSLCTAELPLAVGAGRALFAGLCSDY